MRAWVGHTDKGWYEFLRARPHIREVNFWSPNGTRMTSGILQPGEPFLFKTHASAGSELVGGGFWGGYARVRASQAWELFGEGNGAASLGEMLRAVALYRSAPIDPAEDPHIGCHMLNDVVFFDPQSAALDRWRLPNGVQIGKGYDLGADTSSPVERAAARLMMSGLGDRDRDAYLARIDLASAQPGFELAPVDGSSAHVQFVQRLTKVRLGQRAFAGLVTHAYDERCAITGAKILPVLQAAHIRPVAESGEHAVSNGLLLRADVHLMFDRGLLGVHPQKRTLLVSSRLRETFGNGDEFYALQGQEIRSTRQARDRPAREHLSWHMDEKFAR